MVNKCYRMCDTAPVWFIGVAIVFDIKRFDKILDAYFGRSSHIKLASMSIMMAVWTSIFLIVIKFAAWMFTNSMSMQASLNDSGLDAISSFVAYYALKFSAAKNDKGHNYGHEKIEGIVAIFQCLLVTYSGYIICKEAFEFWVNPQPVVNTSVGISVMIVSCIAVYQLIYFQRYVAAKTDSIIIKGDSLHYLSDFFMNICVMISLFLSKYFLYVDVVCGVIVGAYVLRNAFLIMKNALNDLMDKSLPIDTQEKITQAISSIADIDGIIVLRTRSAGMKKYVEIRVCVSEKLSFLDVNEITRQSESAIKKMFDNADVIVKAELR